MKSTTPSWIKASSNSTNNKKGVGLKQRKGIVHNHISKISHKLHREINQADCIRPENLQSSLSWLSSNNEPKQDQEEKKARDKNLRKMLLELNPKKHLKQALLALFLLASCILYLTATTTTTTTTTNNNNNSDISVSAAPKMTDAIEEPASSTSAKTRAMRSRKQKRTLELSDAVMYKDLEDEPNPNWEDLKATLSTGENSVGPAYGSTVKISRQWIEVGDFAERPIMEDVIMHVPVSSYIGRRNFPNITRWYQEDFHTQVFRMFPGDDNVRNDRINAPRSEAFSNFGWKRGDGWHQWSGRYTFLKVRNGAVFQLKHNRKYWSMQLCIRAAGDGTFNLIYQTLLDFQGAIVLERDVLGKSYDIQVQDDGTYHKVFIDGALRIHNQFTNRTDDEINKSRWGFYSPGSPIDRDILIMVTGAKVEKMKDPNCKPLHLFRSVVDGAQSWLGNLFQKNNDGN